MQILANFLEFLDGPLSLNIAVQNSTTGTDSGIFATQFKLIGPPRITGFSSTTGFEGGPFNVLGNQFVNVTRFILVKIAIFLLVIFQTQL